jgi:hypothetical protein
MRVGFRMWLMSNLEAVLFIAAVALMMTAARMITSAR